MGSLVTETTNGVTKGAAIKVEGSSYVTYLFEDNAWRVYNFGDYEGYQVADEASNYVNEKVNEQFIFLFNSPIYLLIIEI